MSDHDWYLLIHHLPARPLYLRARVAKRLRAAGAVPLKNSVYALPRQPWALEALRAVADDVRAAGATAFLCEASFPDPGDRDRLAATIAARQDADYARLGRDVARATTRRRPGEASPATRSAWVARLASIERIGDFGARRGATVRAAMSPARAGEGSPARLDGTPDLVGRRWVTRRGVRVDRIACAWFVTRFLDPRARFRFVADPAAAAAGEIGFDMPGARFTHEHGNCSLEALVGATGVADPAVRRIAEIVHDLDLGDGRHGHRETDGVGRLLDGLVATTPDDAERLRRGGVLLDDLYRALAPAPRPRVVPPPATRGRRRTAGRRPS